MSEDFNKLQTAIQYHQQGLYDKAKQCYEAIIAAEPTNAQAYSYYGVLEHQLHQSQQALVLLAKAIALDPQNAMHYYNQGVILQALDKYDQAITAFQQAINLQPSFTALNNIGVCYRSLQNDKKAIAYFKKAIQFERQRPEAYNNLGNSYNTLNQPAKAIAMYRQALVIKPTYAQSHINLANALQVQGDKIGALRHYQLAYQHDPNIIQAQLSALQIEEELCEWQNYHKTQLMLQQLYKRELSEGRKTSINPFSAITLPLDTKDQVAIAKSWSDDLRIKYQHFAHQCHFNFARKSVDKIRVAYFSCDFHDHATSHLIKKLFSYHDRNQFEIIVYSYGVDDNSFYRHLIQTSCDKFIDLVDKNDIESAKRIYQDNIHILVDLKGYTSKSRLGTMALRPAPITISYLGYPGSLGADFIDYIITDQVVTPKSEMALYPESCIIMPDTYQITDGHQEIATQQPTRKDCGLPEQGIVFCCFNSNYKIEPMIFNLWMEILTEVPNSVLWLFYSHLIVERNLKTILRDHHIDENRLVFAEKQDKAAHLSRLRLADLFLDTYYVNAHTTASDALWAGVPVLTCPGKAFPSRVAASLLSAIGLPELIMDNHQQYKQQAINLATHPQQLQRLKSILAENRLSKPLFDTQLFTTNLEKAYQHIWQQYLQGQPHRDVIVAKLPTASR